MLEELIKTLMFLVIIVFFIMMCYESIDGALSDYYYKYSSSIGELRRLDVGDDLTDGFKLTYGSGDFIVCKPLLVDNHPGRVCLAS